MDVQMKNTIRLSIGIFLASLGYYLFVHYFDKPESLAIVILSLAFTSVGIALFMTTGLYNEEKRAT